MRLATTPTFLIPWSAAVVACAPAVQGQVHSDVLLQQVDGRIVTGAADFTLFEFTLGARIYTRNFDVNFEAVNPGFAALPSSSSRMPSGAAALPPNTDVAWDFLPMTVGDTVSNLLYWDGTNLGGDGLDADDVAFTTHAALTWSLKGTNAVVAADGTSQVVTGGLIGKTEFDSSLHEHRLMTLADGDGDGMADPPQGIYMIALQIRMAGLETSDPFLFLLRTFDATQSQLDVATDWAQAHLSAPGDYNGNGVVDAADYVVWRMNAGASGMPGMVAGDGTADDLGGVPDGDVDQFDYEFWKANFGKVGLFPDFDTQGAGSHAPTTRPVPELATIALAGLAAITILIASCRRLAGRPYIPYRLHLGCTASAPARSAHLG